MVLESNASAQSPLESPTPTNQLPTSVMDTSWTTNNTNIGPSFQSTPSSRKRKLHNQSIQDYKTGNLMNPTSDEHDSFIVTNNCTPLDWDQPTCHTVKPGYNIMAESSGVDIKMEEDTQVNIQQQLTNSWATEESEWGTEIPTILPCDLGYQSSSQLQAQSVTTNNMMVGRLDTHNLEKAEDIGTPAYMDWSCSVQASTAPTRQMDNAKTVANDDTGLTLSSFHQYHQCLDQSRYSARVTSRNTDTLAPSCLTLSSLDHTPPDYHSAMQQKQKQQGRYNNMQQKHRSSLLSLDLANLPQHQDTPTTPALFSPSFVNALDDIHRVDTLSTPSSLPFEHNTILDQQGTIHQHSNFSYHLPESSMDIGTISYHHPPSPLSSSSSESQMAYEATISKRDFQPTYTNDLYSQRRRSSNNTISSSSSISDSLVTPISYAYTSPMQPESVSPAILSYDQHHQKQHSYASPLSLKLSTGTSATPLPTCSSIPPISQYSPYSRHTMSHSGLSPLRILEEEEEDALPKNQHQRRPIHSISNDLITNQSRISTMSEDIRAYLSSPDAVSSGELTVIISTTKVAQKSYGTEKRFICPPPSVVLIGTDWWTMAQSSRPSDSCVLQPPMIQIQMSNRPTHGELVSMPISAETMEWTTQSGVCWNGATALDNGSSEDINDDSDLTDSTHSFRMKEPIVSGRYISKNMYISDSDDKQKTVELLVRLQLANGLDLGVFKSKGIRVISKPSKKRQTLKNTDSCIHHGSTVALFNRRRSQTVSTRYLCISNMDGTPVFYGNQQQSTWESGSRQKVPDNVCFSAKTQTWDSFFIWIVDESRKETTEDNKNTSWPPAPSIALRSQDPNALIPIYYNQNVILQCINTGLVSPIMAIRKVGNGNTAIGGIHADHILEKQLQSMGLGGDYLDDCLGDPVSQLHKVAFQVINNPISLAPSSHSYTQRQRHFADQSSQPANYLSCINDTVGIYRTSGERHQVSTNKALTESSPSNKPFSTHPSPLTTMSTPLPSSWPDSYGNSNDGGIKCEEYAYCEGQQCEYGQSRDVIGDGPPAYQKRRVSIGIDGSFRLNLPTNTATLEQNRQSPITSRRRYSSANEQTKPLQGNKIARRRNSVLSSTTPSSSVPVDWQEEISDTCIWSIVGTDTTTYTFWPSTNKQQTNKKVVRPVAPTPYIKQYQLIKGNQMVIYGHGFTDDMVVWFGSCMSIMLRATPTELELLIPSALLDGESRFEGQEKATGKDDMGMALCTGLKHGFDFPASLLVWLHRVP